MGASTKGKMMNLTAIPFHRVELAAGFWRDRQKVNREKTIPGQYRLLMEEGRIAALNLDWKEGMPHKPHRFYDSDTAKWIEAASFSLKSHPDRKLEDQLDKTIEKLRKAQQPDGYLNSYYCTVEKGNRLTNLRDGHELYCAGHLMEAAVAHFDATGKRGLLDIMCRYADFICKTFGKGPGQMRGYDGHEVVEMALVKLSAATGNKKYLEQALFFVNERGAEPHFFDQEAIARGDKAGGDFSNHTRHFVQGRYSYYQAHQPVRKQERVTGHAVRAMYLYSAMADLAREYQDKALLAACEKLHDHLVHRNMYVTGGIGSTRTNEGFTFDFDLPNDTGYAETCAQVGMVFFLQRLFHLTGNGAYIDTLERALYNSVVSGVSLDGSKYFYDNRLLRHGHGHDGKGAGGGHAADAGYTRVGWFGCACCPPNLARLVASVGAYLWSVEGTDLYANIYESGTAHTTLAGTDVELVTETKYPYDGKVSITVNPASPVKATVHLRIPGWCTEWSCKVDGKVVRGKLDQGYLAISRLWQAGDKIILDLKMPVVRLVADPRVVENAGKVALQRGPLVYAVEECDVKQPVGQLRLSDKAPLKAVAEKILGGTVSVVGKAEVLVPDGKGQGLYQRTPVKSKAIPFKAIPYFLWDNRDHDGSMAVWLNRG